MGQQAGSGNTIAPVPTGLAELDAALGGGLAPGLTVLASATGEGKTSLALQLCLAAARAAAQSGAGPVIYLGLDMSVAEIWTRLAIESGQLSGIELVRAGSGEKTEALAAAIATLSSLPLEVGVTPYTGPYSVESLISTSPMRPSLLVVDPLNMLGGPAGQGINADGANVRALAAIAREHEVPVLVVAGARRDRGAGAAQLPNEIANVAGLIFLLTRPTLDDSDEQHAAAETGSSATLFVAKNRFGPTVEVALVWQGRAMTFATAES
jgi:replicative DNA helicase